MDILLWIEKWYKEQCDGAWEHDYGVTIETLDNPGWFVRINLKETTLLNKKFENVDLMDSEEDWIKIVKENEEFKGFGDPHKLITILSYFKEFALSE
ncbi:rhodanese-related sulfurtransferase [Listeria sp. FSL L7-0091]|uniref:Rhodanese-related sulfurtransferase n=1 Tax=Listeria farberi TaxID=2713500 RepID=A0A7X0ZG15_9LIST|nr:MULTISPECIES: immunity 53 family protein [Listeria]MBC1374581.1 rhodanese-related sulfurtransferase [Listeria farberi]MBC1380831.1 rhodanese-related sulfurtransferase [Listeria farberi]MBC2262255.1 rhodanese-related sulfurtransferase [Listeria farberi]MBC2267073.1 rhodanese-related sulfurtransferase [Listeria farberi]MBC2286528.1 rhodanese-related sulfurtransferase [Listeria farberi]